MATGIKSLAKLRVPQYFGVSGLGLGACALQIPRQLKGCAVISVIE